MTRSFIKVFKRLGPVLIQINQNNSSIISALGVNSYKFPNLSKNRENSNAILKLTLKAYLNDKIINFDGLGQQNEEKKSLFSFIKTVFIPPMLTSASDSGLVSEIIKNYKEYAWEEVEGFYEIDRCEDIFVSFSPMLIVKFIEFSQSIEPYNNGRSLLALTCKNTLKSALLLALHHAINEIKEFEHIKQEFADLDRCYTNHFNFKILYDCFDVIQSDLKDFLNQIIKNVNETAEKINRSTFEIADKDSRIDKKCNPISEDMEHDLNSTLQDNLQINLIDESCTSDKTAEINSGCHAFLYSHSISKCNIAEDFSDLFDIDRYNRIKSFITEATFDIDVFYDIYLKNFDYFLDFSLLIQDYEENNDRETVEKNPFYVKVISKITDYQKTIQNILSHYYTLKGEKCYDSFYRLAKKFDKKSQNIALKKLSCNLKPYLAKEAESKAKLKNGNVITKIKENLSGVDINDICYFMIKDVLPCFYLSDKYFIYLLADRICILNCKSRCVDAVLLRETDIYLYNRKIYIISNIFNSSYFQVHDIGKGKGQMICFDIFNRESTEEFIIGFKCVKHDCKYVKKLFFREESSLLNMNNSTKIYDQKDKILKTFFDIKDDIKKQKEAENQNFRKLRILESELELFEDKIKTLCYEITKSNRSKQKDFMSITKVRDTIFDFYIRYTKTLQEKKFSGTESEVFWEVLNDVNIRKKVITKESSYYEKLISILKSINLESLKIFSLDLYPEEDTPLKRKTEIIEKIKQALKNSKNTNVAKTNIVITKFYDLKRFIFENDVLNQFSPEEQNFYLNLYHSLLENNKILKMMLSNNNIKEIVIVLSMILQRNLYYMFDPIDLEKIIKEHLIGEQDGIETFKNYTKSNLKVLKDIFDIISKRSDKEELSNYIYSAFCLT